jgi:hypothetical protein
MKKKSMKTTKKSGDMSKGDMSKDSTSK